jgi:cytidylate kinase
MEPYTITITRQFGSLGRQIGKRLAERLQCQYYDRNVIEREAAKRDESLGSLVTLQHVEGYYKMAYPLGIGSALKQEKMFQVQCDILREHAAAENCVIVGRCADYVLRDKAQLLRCYIYAPDEDRIRNGISSLDINTADFQSLIDEVDKARAAYYEKYTGYAVDNLVLRDLIVNSSCLGVRGTTEMLAQFAAKKFHLQLDPEK